MKHFWSYYPRVQFCLCCHVQSGRLQRFQCVFSLPSKIKDKSQIKDKCLCVSRKCWILPACCWLNWASTLTVRSRRRNLNWSNSRPSWRCEWHLTSNTHKHSLTNTQHQSSSSCFLPSSFISSHPLDSSSNTSPGSNNFYSYWHKDRWLPWFATSLLSP